MPVSGVLKDRRMSRSPSLFLSSSSCQSWTFTRPLKTARATGLGPDRVGVAEADRARNDLSSRRTPPAGRTRRPSVVNAATWMTPLPFRLTWLNLFPGRMLIAIGTTHSTSAVDLSGVVRGVRIGVGGVRRADLDVEHDFLVARRRAADRERLVDHARRVQHERVDGRGVGRRGRPSRLPTVYPSSRARRRSVTRARGCGRSIER